MITESTKNRIFEETEAEKNWSLLKPKHAKKDYEVISDISVEDIINSATIAPKK